jgi:hypothetical protein
MHGCVDLESKMIVEFARSVLMEIEVGRVMENTSARCEAG